MEKTYESKRASNLLSKFLQERNIPIAQDSQGIPESRKEIDRMLEEKGRIAWLREITGLSERDLNVCTWDNFEVTPENRSYVEDFKNWEPGDVGFFMHGKWGIGKTHMLKAHINYNASDSYRCRFYEMPKFCARLREYVAAGELHYFKQNLYRNCQLLALDDLGSENTTDFVAHEFFDVLQTCLNRNITLFMTSNLTPEELKVRYHQRTLDRLREIMIPIHVTVKESYRAKILAENMRRLKDKRETKGSVHLLKKDL